MKIKFIDTKSTINKVRDLISRRIRGMYLRFGDGDIKLATGSSGGRHKYNPKMAIEMQESFAIDHPNVLRTLPIHSIKYGLEEGMYYKNDYEWCHAHPDSWCDRYIERIRKYWGGNMDVVYSPNALSYLACHDPHFVIDFFRYLKSTNDQKLFIGNKNSDKSIIKLLFGDCDFVPTPPKNSYQEIERIYKDALDLLNDKKHYLILMAMGCPGRVLSKRLWLNYNDNFFVFDVGSILDALMDTDTRVWITFSKFDKNNFLYVINDA